MIKKILVPVMLVAALFTGLSAQAKFSIGPKIGLNVDKIHLSNSHGLKSDEKCGFTAGVTAEYMIPVVGFGVDLSLMYSRQNAEVDGAKIHSNFFEIPLNLKYKIGIPAISNIIRPYVYTGPTAAFRFGHDEWDLKKAQWGWNLGLGVELINHLQIGAGYTFGITKIAEIVTNVQGDVIKLRNNYWTVSAAWLF